MYVWGEAIKIGGEDVFILVIWNINIVYPEITYPTFNVPWFLFEKMWLPMHTTDYYI